MKLISSIIFFLILCATVFYVAMSNDLVTKGIVLQALKKEKNDLVEERKNLDIATAKLRSFAYLSPGFKNSGFVEANDIEYIQVAKINIDGQVSVR